MLVKLKDPEQPKATKSKKGEEQPAPADLPTTLTVEDRALMYGRYYNVGSDLSESFYYRNIDLFEVV